MVLPRDYAATDYLTLIKYTLRISPVPTCCTCISSRKSKQSESAEHAGNAGRHFFKPRSLKHDDPLRLIDLLESCVSHHVRTSMLWGRMTALRRFHPDDSTPPH